MAVLKIPHIQQSQESSCGAAALSMIYRYLGRNDQTEEVVYDRLKVHRPNTKNQLYLKSFDMARDGQKQGFSYFIGRSVLDSVTLALQPLKEFLSYSVPIIVCQEISHANKWGHFRVVTQIEKDKVIFNDPLNENGKSSLNVDDFISLWQKSDNGEVIGGQFLAIFRKESIDEKAEFTVFTFESSIKYFNTAKLVFI